MKRTLQNVNKVKYGENYQTRTETKKMDKSKVPAGGETDTQKCAIMP